MLCFKQIIVFVSTKPCICLGKSLPPRAVIKSTVLQLIFARLPSSTMFRVNTWKGGNQVRAYLTDLFGYSIYCKIGQCCFIVICKSEGILEA